MMNKDMSVTTAGRAVQGATMMERRKEMMLIREDQAWAKMMRCGCEMMAMER